MHQVTVYKNIDKSQPLIFRGKSTESVMKKLCRWMSQNNGENRNPSGCDGLTVFDTPDGDVCLLYEDGYGDWLIECDQETDAAGSFEEMSKSFTDTVLDWAEWRF